MKPILAVCALSLMAGAGWGAECVGQNLIEGLSAEDRAWIANQTKDIPYHEGILWHASKGNARISLIGTYHFDHPQHKATVAAMRDELTSADHLLVELGPEEDEALKSALLSDPTLIVDMTGPTLPERLSEVQWQDLGAALEERGIPAVMASRMRPWYVATMLAMSPCVMEQLAQGKVSEGLDRQLMQVAEEAGVPIKALEPWDTVIKLFSELSPQEEVDMIVYSLPVASYADSYTRTMEDAYAAGDVWQIWEFSRLDAHRNSGLTPEEVDRMTEETEELLLNARNRSWIEPLTEAADAAAGKDLAVVAAFGALHLPGEEGVLRLLEKDGWTIERMD